MIKTLKIELDQRAFSMLIELNHMRAQSASETIGELIREAHEKYVPTQEHPNGWAPANKQKDSLCDGSEMLEQFAKAILEGAKKRNG